MAPALSLMLALVVATLPSVDAQSDIVVGNDVGVFVGCFNDNTPSGTRALPNKQGSTGVSADGCLTACLTSGYTYMGRQYQGECYCGGGTYSSQGVADPTKCSCNDNTYQTQGNSNCVYQIMKLTTTTTSSSSRTTTTTRLTTTTSTTLVPTTTNAAAAAAAAFAAQQNISLSSTSSAPLTTTATVTTATALVGPVVPPGGSMPASLGAARSQAIAGLGDLLGFTESDQAIHFGGLTHFPVIAMVAAGAAMAGAAVLVAALAAAPRRAGGNMHVPVGSRDLDGAVGTE